MTPDVEAFLKELSLHPAVLAAARANPKFYGDMLRLEEGLKELERTGESDWRRRALYAEVRLEVVREERSFKQRLLRISEIMERARADLPQQEKKPPPSGHDGA
jgi:hypothetical protein